MSLLGHRLYPARPMNAEIRFALVAARWAQMLGLPFGNLWEPAIVRVMIREWHNFGGDDLAASATEGIFAVRLGIEP